MFNSFIIVEILQLDSPVCSQFTYEQTSALYANFALISLYPIAYAMEKQGDPISDVDWKNSYLERNVFLVSFSLSTIIQNNVWNWATVHQGARGIVVGWGTMIKAERLRVRFPMRLLYMFNLPNHTNLTTVLGWTQPLTEMSSRNLPRRVKAAGA
jgi:hypothetical protein